MSKTSPTQRSLKLLRDRGYHCQIVEHWNSFARRRVDLFGVIDLLGISEGQILGVQTTSGANASKRLDKIRESMDAAMWLLAGGLLQVHSWRKTGGRGKRKTWHCRVVRATLSGGDIEFTEMGDV